MSDEPKKIIVDDDWKQEAKAEKERLKAESEQKQQQLPDASFPELINLIVMQAMAALGLLQGPNGERMPPQPPVAKHFIDLLQLLEEKTQGNLSDEEKKLLDQVLYETRMAFVQITSGGGGMPGGAGGDQPGGPMPPTGQ
jgi:hypothetical protein